MTQKQDNTKLTLRQKLLIGFAFAFLISAVIVLVAKVVWLLSVLTK